MSESETSYSTTNKGSKIMYVEGVESGVCGFIQSNLTHVRGVESGVCGFIQSNLTHAGGVESA